MAKKDFEDYYKKVYSQFYSLQQVFDDLTEEIAKGMVEPERKEQLEKTIEPIKNSFQTLSYIKYLLDKPARKHKEPRYKRANKKLLELSQGKHANDILKNNQDIINSLHK